MLECTFEVNIRPTNRVRPLSPVLLSRFSLALRFVQSCVYMSISIFPFISPLSSPLGAHIFALYIYVSIFALQLSSTVPLF